MTLSAIEQCRATEADGLAWVCELIRQARLPVIENKSLGAERDSVYEAQQKLGDVVTWLPEFGAAYLEVKVEQRHTGNLFLEAWSNLTSGRFRNQGWMAKSLADFVLFTFLDTGDIYVAKFAPLFDWFYVNNADAKYRRTEQRKHEQRNRTVGTICPIPDVKQAVGIDHLRCKRDGETWRFSLLSADDRSGFADKIYQRVPGMMTRL